MTGVRSGPYYTFGGGQEKDYRPDSIHDRVSPPGIPATGIFGRALYWTGGPDSMKKVYSTTLLAQAEILRVVLREHGIDSLLENQNSAMYAAGVPIPAIPFVISVADEHAEEATRIVLAHLKGDHEPVGSAIHVRTPCACGKMIEVRQGEEPPEECPWCGRILSETAPPPPSRASGPPARFAFIVCVLIGLGALFWIRSGAGKKSSEPASPSQAEWSARLRQRIAAIPVVTAPAIDPDAIAEPLIRELSEEAARFSSVIDSASSPGTLIDEWVRQMVVLAPDWALTMGLAESPRLTPYSTLQNKRHALLDALALRKLRSFPSRHGTLDGRLFERELEQSLVWTVLFGTELKDPRAPLWNVRSSAGVTNNPALLAQRLEQVPDGVRRLAAELPQPPRIWIEAALRELNQIMELLRDWDNSTSDARLKEAVKRTRDALADYGSRLRRSEPGAGSLPSRDPRWISYLLKELEFSERTVRQTAELLLDLSDRSEAGWRSWPQDRKLETKPFSFPEWQEEIRRLVSRARDLTVERGFADVPAGDPPEVVASPYSIPSDYYESRTFGPTAEARLRIAPWDPPGGTLPCSPEGMLIAVMSETYPGRHLHTMLSRRDATVMQRLYSSVRHAEGWREYCRRWALESEPPVSYHRASADGHRYFQGFIGAVQICYLSGTLTEQESLTILVAGIGQSEESARAHLAEATLEPLYGTQSLLGEHDLTALRGELRSKPGGRFDLKAFHARILGSGQTPVALLREAMLPTLK